MSELKAFDIVVAEEGYFEGIVKYRRAVYDKSEADKVIAELEEERRWRKFPDEKPSEEGYYIICGSSGFRNADKWTYCKDRQKMDFSFYSYGVKYWMPMPSAPKEENK
jgi:hypothetical protein